MSLTKQLPGKTTQTEADRTVTKVTQPGRASGSPWMADPMCDRPGTEAWCPLPANQRAYLRRDFQGRVIVAEGRFNTAAAEIRLEKMIEKDSDLPLILSIMVDAIGAHVIGKVAGALIAARHVHGMSDGRVTGFVKAAVDATKKGATKAATDGSSKRDVYAKYIETIRDQAAVTFQGIRENALIEASDDDLVTLHRAFEAENHQISDYRAALQAKIERFETSGVNRIGTTSARAGDSLKPRTAGWSLKQDALGIGSHRTIGRSTKVVWLVVPGQPRTLGFEYHDSNDSGAQCTYEDRRRNGPTLSDDLRGPNEALYGQPWMGPEVIVTSDVNHFELVDPEFYHEAIARHLEVWTMPPIDRALPYLPIRKTTLGDVK